MTKNIAITADQYVSSEGLVVPKNSAVRIISENDLKKSNFSPSSYKELLRNIEEARSRNCEYVEYDNYLLEIPKELFLT